MSQDSQTRKVPSGMPYFRPFFLLDPRRGDWPVRTRFVGTGSLASRRRHLPWTMLPRRTLLQRYACEACPC